MRHAAVINGAGGSDLALQVAVLLHGIGDGFVGFQLRVRFDLGEDTRAYGIDPPALLVAAFSIHAAPSAKRGNRSHRILVKVYRAFYDSRHVLQDLHALFKEVVDVRGFGLNALLELLEIVAGRNLHEDENDSRQDTCQASDDADKQSVFEARAHDEDIRQDQHGDSHPQCDFEKRGAKADPDRQLAVNHIHITAVVVHRAGRFI